MFILRTQLCDPHFFQKCCHFHWIQNKVSKNDKAFERNEDPVTGFIKWTDFTYRVLGFPLHWQFLNGLDYRQIHWLWSYSFQCKYACISVKFSSNSDFSKTPITPHVSCHVLGTQRLNFWCCFSRKITAYLKRLFCNLQYKNVSILLGFGPILNF